MGMQRAGSGLGVQQLLDMGAGGGGGGALGSGGLGQMGREQIPTAIKKVIDEILEVGPLSITLHPAPHTSLPPPCSTLDFLESSRMPA